MSIILYAMRVLACLRTSQFNFLMAFIFSSIRFTAVFETTTNDDIPVISSAIITDEK